MTTQTAESKTHEILLADTLDIESALHMRHWARQYKSERKALEHALPSARRMSNNAGRLAVAYWALDRINAALEHADKEVKDPLCVLLQGIIAEEAGKCDEALKHYQKAAELAPSSPPCVLRQLSAMRKLGQTDEALALIEKLRKEFSDKADLAYYEGRCYEDRLEYQKALDCYERAMAINERHAEAIFHAARLCDQRGLTEEAKELYRKLGPGKESTYLSACMNLALIYEDEGDFDNAILCCQRVLKVNPNNTRARLFLSDIEASSDMYYSPEETKQSEQLEAVLRTPVSDFELSVRSRNCLASMNIQTLGDLVKKTESEMLAYKNFGETSLREIKDILSSRALRLGMMREDAATRAAMERARRNANQELLNKPIAEMELGVRSRKCMERLQIKTIGELVSRTEPELASTDNFGRVSLNEIKKRLNEMGLSLKHPEEA